MHHLDQFGVFSTTNNDTHQQCIVIAPLSTIHWASRGYHASQMKAASMWCQAIGRPKAAVNYHHLAFGEPIEVISSEEAARRSRSNNVDHPVTAS